MDKIRMKLTKKKHNKYEKKVAANQATNSISYSNNIEWFDPKPLQLALPVASRRVLSDPVSPADSFVSASDNVSDTSRGMLPADAHSSDGLSYSVDCEVSDQEEYTDTDLGAVDEHKSIILHLLSQLKLGMDLTKVVLPTFILEKRSLLELFADFMAHPDMFICIPDLVSPEERMLAVVEWYLTAFHAGRKGSIAKKPYNPIIGETFHCSWHVPHNYKSYQSHISLSTNIDSSNHTETPVSLDLPKPTLGPGRSPQLCKKSIGGNRSPGVPRRAPQSLPSAWKGANEQGSSTDQDEVCAIESEPKGSVNPTLLRYCAEQVSHHPPVSAFYFECPEKRVCMNASIWTKSKFMGMSIGVVMVGKVRLCLPDTGEEYEFSLPSAYARSILTVPWVELGDKINITCNKTGYTASVTFQTKPFYGGKLHRVTSEVKNPVGECVCKVNGEWNGQMQFSYNKEESKIIDTTKMSKLHKRVRPLASQTEMESRRLWQNVTENLKKEDIDTATQHKRFLEERQRQAERHRKETNTPYPTKYFHKEDDSWVFNNPLVSPAIIDAKC